MKVLDFGSLNIDNVYSVDHFVRGGETISSEKLEVFSGGKGLNQSIALSKALAGSGILVYHAGAVGKEDGDFLLTQLEEAGVDISFTARLPVKTGHAIIQRDRTGQNCILLFGGANQAVTEEMADEVLKDFEAGDFLILQNEISQIRYIMEKAHEKGMKIFLNPSPMDEKIAGYPLEYVDCFLLNEIEAAGICGIEEDAVSKEELLDQISRRFPDAQIVLTLGGEGSMYKKGDFIAKQGIYKVPVADTTAAGDTFTGYFIGGIARGESIEEALDHGARASAIAVSRPGAAPSIPDRDEVEKMGKRG